jgi:hypothetical protein
MRVRGKYWRLRWPPKKGGGEMTIRGKLISAEPQKFFALGHNSANRNYDCEVEKRFLFFRWKVKGVACVSADIAVEEHIGTNVCFPDWWPE